MSQLFWEGGVLFMGLLTLLLLIILSLAVVSGLKLLSKKHIYSEKVKAQLTYIRSVGLFALVTGILGQLIGLYEGFKAVEADPEHFITPAIVAYGFRISSICNLYGIFIFLFSLLLWFGLHVWYTRLSTVE